MTESWMGSGVRAEGACKGEDARGTEQGFYLETPECDHSS